MDSTPASCAGPITAERAPAVFSLDEWGYASLARGLSADTELPADLEQPARRALLDCPVHAITVHAKVID